VKKRSGAVTSRTAWWKSCVMPKTTLHYVTIASGIVDSAKIANSWAKSCELLARMPPVPHRTLQPLLLPRRRKRGFA